MVRTLMTYAVDKCDSPKTHPNPGNDASGTNENVVIAMNLDLLLYMPSMRYDFIILLTFVDKSIC